MEAISIKEFRRLSKLSKAQTLELIEEGEIECALIDNEVKINLDSLSPDIVAKKLQHDSNNKTVDIELFEEQIAEGILNQLDSIIADAVKLSVGWIKEDKPKKSD